jgi:hypothetical protein
MSRPPSPKRARQDTDFDDDDDILNDPDVVASAFGCVSILLLLDLQV